MTWKVILNIKYLHRFSICSDLSPGHGLIRTGPWVTTIKLLSRAHEHCIVSSVPLEEDEAGYRWVCCKCTDAFTREWVTSMRRYCGRQSVCTLKWISSQSSEMNKYRYTIAADRLLRYFTEFQTLTHELALHTWCLATPPPKMIIPVLLEARTMLFSLPTSEIKCIVNDSETN